MTLLAALGDAVATTGRMTWQIAWSLILGFAIAAMARSLVRKGGNFTAAMAFQIASTNLVIELGIILTILIGWQFTAAEFVGGAVMIVLVVMMFGRLVSARTVEAARTQADRAVAGSMEGHAAMDMSVHGSGSWLRRLVSKDGWTSISTNFVMEWAAIARDLVMGLFIAGAAAAWVPDSFWQHLFLGGHPTLARFIDPLIAPFVAIATFVCSIGNVPLTAVLWNGGITFGGVVALGFSFLNITFGMIAAVLVFRFLSTGGRAMLSMMGGHPDQEAT